MTAREVRKTVTILFCDLVHSTGLAEGTDPETFRRVQSRYFEEMRDVVESHGGTVEKFVGDEVMAVFGVPIVHEDDALRAVRAGRQMLDRLEKLNDELEATWGVRLRARIGVNTGEVVAGDAGDGGSFVTGEPVIVAKRLEQAAGAGEILIGKTTYPLVEHSITAGPLERIPIKGKREDVGRRRVDEVDRAAPSMVRRLDVPIVGRDEELGLLRQAFERSVDERSCRLFTVLGPAGIGKSRLAAELASSVADKAATAIGRCLPYGEGITFWPLTEVLESVGGEDALEEALDPGERDVVLALLRGATGAGEAQGSSEETFWAVRRAFEALARERPLVVCLEDLHWAEPTLLDLIEYVVGWSRDAPIFVLCLARPELVERRPTLIAPQPNADALALEPLSPGDTVALLDRLSSESLLGADVRERIGAAAEGNPLFVEQMAAMAAERTGEGEAGLAIPPSIHALLVERLDRLAPEERAVVERASVIGRDFSLPAVASLSSREQRDSLARDLLSLVRKGFVRPDRGRSGQEARFSFNHVLIRDTAYDAMPKELRAKLHERLADWAEESGPTREVEDLFAYHLEQAYRLRSEVGLRDDDLAARAGRALAAAGRRAEAREDVPATLSFLTRAIVLLPAEQPLRAELLLELGSMYMNAGRFDDAHTVLEEGGELAATLGDRRLELRSKVDLSFIATFTEPEGSTDRIAEIGASVVPELEELGDHLGLAKAWHLLSEPEVIACRWGARMEALEHALEHARKASDRRLQAMLINLLCTTLIYGPIPVQEGIRRCEDFLAEAGNNLPVEAGALSTLAALRAMHGDFTEARALWARAAQIYEDLGLRYRRALRSLVPAEIELLAGYPEAAVREVRHGYDLLEEMGERGTRSTLAAYLADALYIAARPDEAYELTEISEEIAASDDIATQAIWRCVRAKVLAGRGDQGQAEKLVLEAEQLAEPTDFPDLQARPLTSRAEVLRASGRATEATPLLEQARAIYERKGNLAAAAHISR